MPPREPPRITDPESRHNLHVTREADLIAVGPWSRAELYAAVERADAADRVVVLDYGRERIYLVDESDVTYLSPKALGFADAPGVRLAEPQPYSPSDGTVGRIRAQTVVVSPEFDLLIPAFDWSEPDDEWEPPELDYRDRPAGSPTGAIGGD